GRGLEAAPGDAAGALDLAALHGEPDLVGAGIARHRLDRRAEHVLDDGRVGIEHVVVTGEAEADLLGQEILPALRRRALPGNTGIGRLVHAADPAELARIVLVLLGIH